MSINEEHILLYLIYIIYVHFCSFDVERIPVIYMIGDSTMADKSLSGGNPERGWGQMFPGFLTPDIHVDNRALNGRSTRSFRNEGHWELVRKNFVKGIMCLSNSGIMIKKLILPVIQMRKPTIR